MVRSLAKVLLHISTFSPGSDSEKSLKIVTTHVRAVGSLVMVLLPLFPWFRQWKKF